MRHESAPLPRKPMPRLNFRFAPGIRERLAADAHSCPGCTVASRVLLDVISAPPLLATAWLASWPDMLAGLERVPEGDVEVGVDVALIDGLHFAAEAGVLGEGIDPAAGALLWPDVAPGAGADYAAATRSLLTLLAVLHGIALRAKLGATLPRPVAAMEEAGERVRELLRQTGMARAGAGAGCEERN